MFNLGQSVMFSTRVVVQVPFGLSMTRVVHKAPIEVVTVPLVPNAVLSQAKTLSPSHPLRLLVACSTLKTRRL